MLAPSRQTSSPDLPSPPTLSVKNQLFSQQIAQLYAHAPLGIIASIVTGLILVLVLWNVIPHWMLLSWYVCIVVVNVFWCILAYSYRRVSPPVEEAPRWGYLVYCRQCDFWTGLGRCGIHVISYGFYYS